jgi:hypothetical protein
MVSRSLRKIAAALLCAVGMAAMTAIAKGQSFGIELNNTLMPASGAMGGVSIAQPQDLTSSLNGNPAAALAASRQFRTIGVASAVAKVSNR